VGFGQDVLLTLVCLKIIWRFNDEVLDLGSHALVVPRLGVL